MDRAGPAAKTPPRIASIRGSGSLSQSGASMPTHEGFNFYKAIEQLPQLPLEVKLQAKKHIENIER